jgi:hypothetical protein
MKSPRRRQNFNVFLNERKLMAHTCLRHILDPDNIIVPTLVFCDDEVPYNPSILTVTADWDKEMSAYAIDFQLLLTMKAKRSRLLEFCSWEVFLCVCGDVCRGVSACVHGAGCVYVCA